MASAISSQPLEYSYFDTNAVSTLSGAGHWMIQAKLNSLKRGHNQDNGAGPAAKGRKKTATVRRKPGRKPKGDKRIDFESDLDVNKAIPLGSGRPTVTSKEKMEECKQESALLEDDIGFNSESLQHLFTKHDLWVSQFFA